MYFTIIKASSHGGNLPGLEYLTPNLSTKWCPPKIKSSSSSAPAGVSKWWYFGTSLHCCKPKTSPEINCWKQKYLKQLGLEGSLSVYKFLINFQTETFYANSKIIFMTCLGRGESQVHNACTSFSILAKKAGAICKVSLAYKEPSTGRTLRAHTTVAAYE